MTAAACGFSRSHTGHSTLAFRSSSSSLLRLFYFYYCGEGGGGIRRGRGHGKKTHNVPSSRYPSLFIKNAQVRLGPLSGCGLMVAAKDGRGERTCCGFCFVCMLLSVGRFVCDLGKKFPSVLTTRRKMALV